MSRSKLSPPRPATINVGLFQALSELPSGLNKNRVWTKEEDEALLEFWPKKRKDDISRVLGVCVQNCRKRYLELTKG